MLQWMGGSRRKVTASRKSTQKRQKQYFEQRKRQQQASAWRDECCDTTDTCTLRHVNTQSLDILSLRDLSTTVQEHMSSCHHARESLDGDVSKLNCQTTPELPKLHTSEVAPAEPNEFRGDTYQCETTPELPKLHTSEVAPAEPNEFRGDTYQCETIYPERVSRASAGNHYKDLNGSGNVVQLDMTNDLQLSVLDLLGDDGPNNSSEGKLVNEAHVAFSVEGLGNVEMETPVHSPQQPIRDFQYGCSSSSRGTRKTRSLKTSVSRLDNLAAEVDYLTEGEEILFLESELPSSRCMMDSFSASEQNFSDKGYLPINNESLKIVLGNEDIFSNGDKIDNMWTESFTLRDDDCPRDSKRRSSRKNWPYQMNSNSADYLQFEDHDFAFQFANKNRAYSKGTNTLDIIDSGSPYAKYQVPETHLDITNSDGTWYPELRSTSVRSATTRPVWSGFTTEDAQESLSFLSEESCSSRAVRSKANEDLLSNYAGKQMRAYSDDCWSSETKKGCQLWNEDLFNVDSVSQQEVNAKLYAETSRSNIHMKYYPRYSEKLACHRPFNYSHSSETSFLPERRSRSDKSTSSPDFGTRGNAHNQFKAIGRQGHTRSPDIPICESGFLDREKKSEILQELELGEDACDGSNCLSAENRTTGDALDAGDSCSNFSKSEDITEEVDCSGEARLPEEEENVSSVEEAPDKIKDDLDRKEYQKNVRSHLSKIGCEDIEEPGHKERSIEKKQNSSADSSCQVTMLESYTLQLLCMHVLKGASTWETGKKEG